MDREQRRVSFECLWTMLSLFNLHKFHPHLATTRRHARLVRVHSGSMHQSYCVQGQTVLIRSSQRTHIVNATRRAPKFPGRPILICEAAPYACGSQSFARRWLEDPSINADVGPARNVRRNGTSTGRDALV